MTLMDAVNETRLRVWSEQPPEFFTQAIIEGDGTLVETDAECKQGVDIAYDGTWSYDPLLISLANTAEPLYLVNRSGNRPSQEQAELYFDKAISLCRRAGFQKILLRGDTKFTQCTHLDRWDVPVTSNSSSGWPPRTISRNWPTDSHPRRTASWNDHPGMRSNRACQQPERVKQQIVRERGFETIHTLEEMVAEFEYCPVACHRSYRVIVVRKLLGTDKGQMRLFEEYRYFFYITNDRVTPADEIVFSANDRCDQENLIAQLKSGVRADDAGGRLGEQLGLYGDGQFGLEPEGLECLDDTGIAPACGQTPSRETIAVADGVRDVLCGDDPDALPDRAKRWTVDLPLAVVEPVARGLPATGRSAARLLAVLGGTTLKSGSGCPDPRRPSNQEREQDMKQRVWRRSVGGVEPPGVVEGTLSDKTCVCFI